MARTLVKDTIHQREARDDIRLSFTRQLLYFLDRYELNDVSDEEVQNLLGEGTMASI